MDKLHIVLVAAAHLVMGATFGLYHLVYAVCVWASRQPDAREILAPE